MSEIPTSISTPLSTRPPAKVILGTRSSLLALAQADLTAAALRRAWPETQVEIRKITTSGDQKLDLSLIKQTPAGAKGLFTKELEEALRRGEIDVAVHSCKDMPGEMLPGLSLAATLERANTADVLITKTASDFDALPLGAHLGTSSVRRARQLLWKRPDLVMEEIRGNVQTRLRKLRASATLEGTVLAQAGLERLGFQLGTGRLDSGEEGIFYVTILDTLPAIGQGAIALQTRTEDAAAFAALNHEPTWLAIRAERELMRLLQGDCNLPVGVITEQTGTLPDAAMRMRVLLFGPEGEAPDRADVEGRAAAPEALAAAAFEALGQTKE